jgi:hypothetical protein
MKAPVYFDRKPGRGAIEIDDIESDRMLAPEPTVGLLEKSFVGEAASPD